MTTLAAILLALFVLPFPWSVVAIIAGAAIDLGETALWFRWSHRRRAQVGVEALIGQTAVVVTPCRPVGQVRIVGELWRARCDEGADTGDEVVVRGLDGLTLDVDRI